MKILVVVLSLITFSINLWSQDKSNPIKREGFILGLSAGGGVISISDKGQENPFDKAQGGISLPNLKFGWMLSEHMAILGSFTGITYTFEGEDRSFDAFMPSVQYWIKDRWWLNGGVGLAMDFPAFYEDTDSEGEDFHFGCAAAISTGYEIHRKNNFAIDLQSKIHLGRVFMENDQHRDGAAFSLGIGFNWY